jgi:hypothetical protein
MSADERLTAGQIEDLYIAHRELAGHYRGYFWARCLDDGHYMLGCLNCGPNEEDWNGPGHIDLFEARLVDGFEPG